MLVQNFSTEVLLDRMLTALSFKSFMLFMLFFGQQAGDALRVRITESKTMLTHMVKDFAQSRHFVTCVNQMIEINV